MGGWDAEQVCNGYIAGFNLWDIEMSHDQINIIGCDDVGNILTYNDFLLEDRSYSYEYFPCGELCKMFALSYNYFHS